MFCAIQLSLYKPVSRSNWRPSKNNSKKIRGDDFLDACHATNINQYTLYSQVIYIKTLVNMYTIRFCLFTLFTKVCPYKACLNETRWRHFVSQLQLFLSMNNNVLALCQWRASSIKRIILYSILLTGRYPYNLSCVYKVSYSFLRMG